jgi:hypothetical protein
MTELSEKVFAKASELSQDALSTLADEALTE